MCGGEATAHYSLFTCRHRPSRVLGTVQAFRSEARNPEGLDAVNLSSQAAIKNCLMFRAAIQLPLNATPYMPLIWGFSTHKRK